MAKARAIVKRRKAVRNIRKITKTMQMIATAKFQKSLKRAVGTKPYTMKVRELVNELAQTVGGIEHPLLRTVTDETRTKRIALLVITSNRGLAGAYNGNVLRMAVAFIRQQEAEGKTIELYVAGKKGGTYFNFQRRPVVQRYDSMAEQPTFAGVEPLADQFMQQFSAGQLDSVHVASMDFLSTSRQQPRVLTLLPLAGVREAAEHIATEATQKDAQSRAGAANRSHVAPAGGAHSATAEVTYDFSPSAAEILADLLPQTVKTALFQCFLDAVTSENVARMVAMKSATDNADKMVRSLTMRYNRARQSQITTELSEIMGGAEALKA